MNNSWMRLIARRLWNLRRGVGDYSLVLQRSSWVSWEIKWRFKLKEGDAQACEGKWWNFKTENINIGENLRKDKRVQKVWRRYKTSRKVGRYIKRIDLWNERRTRNFERLVFKSIDRMRSTSWAIKDYW